MAELSSTNSSRPSPATAASTASPAAATSSRQAPTRTASPSPNPGPTAQRRQLSEDLAVLADGREPVTVEGRAAGLRGRLLEARTTAARKTEHRQTGRQPHDRDRDMLMQLPAGSRQPQPMHDRRLATHHMPLVTVEFVTVFHEYGERRGVVLEGTRYPLECLQAGGTGPRARRQCSPPAARQSLVRRWSGDRRPGLWQHPRGSGPSSLVTSSPCATSGAAPPSALGPLGAGRSRHEEGHAVQLVDASCRKRAQLVLAGQPQFQVRGTQAQSHQGPVVNQHASLSKTRAAAVIWFPRSSRHVVRPVHHRRGRGVHKPQPSEPRHCHTLSHLTAVVPAETVGCSGVTAWRQMRDWTGAGFWPRLHCSLLTELRRATRWIWTTVAWRARMSEPSKRGLRRPSPVNRARPGSKHHLLVDRHGTPLAVTLTSGNRHDVPQLPPLLDAVPPIRGLRGHPRRKPLRLYADRGYDFDKYRRLLWRDIKPLIARRGVAHGSGLGKGALGDRARFRLAAPIQATPDPLRATR